MRIAAVGDVMCGESFYQYLRGPRSQIDQWGAAFLDQELITLLRSHDIVFANLECVLSDVGHRPRSLRSHQMRGRPTCARLLRQWGINLVNVANNHMLEHGRAAAIETLAHVRSAGITVVGAGPGERFAAGLAPVFLAVAGLRVGVLAACNLREPYAAHGNTDEESLLTAVEELRPQCDALIVSLHWGIEYMDRPTAAQRTYARRLVDAGARLILGHHPHVVQGAEVYRNGLIAYSLGNFIFDQVVPDTRWSVVLSITLPSSSSCLYEAIPIVVNDQHQPHIGAGDMRYALVTKWRDRCAALSMSARDEDAYAEDQRRRQRAATAALRRAVLTRLPSMPASYGLQVLARPVVRRLGLW